MYNNNPGLPHRTDVLESQPMQFAPNQPPAVFSVPIHPDVSQFLPMLASALANEITARSQNNAIRVFQYNLASANQYNNQYFAMLLDLAAGILSLNHRKGLIQEINRSIGEAAYTAVISRVSMLIAEFPQLATMVDQGIVNEAIGNQQVAANLMNEVQAFQRQLLGGQQAYGGGSQLGNGRFSPQNQIVAPAQVNQRHLSQVDRAMSGGVGNSPFASNNAAPGAPAGPVGGREYHVARPVTPPQQVANSAPQAPPPANVPVLNTSQVPERIADESVPVDEDKTTLVWASSRTQLFKPGFNRMYQKRQLSVQTESDKKIVVATIVLKREDEMNREDHQLSSIKKTAIQPALAPAIDVTKENAFKAPPPNDEAFTTRDGDDAGICEPEKRWIYAPSNHTLNFVGKSLAVLAGNPPAHIVFGSSGNAITLTADIKDTAAMDFGDVCTYDEVRSVLRRIRKQFTNPKLKGDDSPEDSALLDQCRSLARYAVRMNQIFTDEFNSVVENKLGLVGWKIDDFLEDSESILSIIRSNLGQQYYDALMDYQEKFVGSCITSMQDTKMEELVFQGQLSEEEDKVLFPVLIPENVAFVYLGVMSDQLYLDLKTSEPIGILQSSLPALHNLLWATYRRIKMSGKEFKHCYVVTSDDIVFEAHQGLIGTMVYSLRRISL